MFSAARFLLDVWRPQGDGYFCISTKSKSGKWRDLFLQTPFNRAKLERILEDNSDRNLYFCITPFSEPRRQKRFVTGSRFLWADLDEADPRKLKLKPQIAWASSPGRYAALWRLNKFHKTEPIEEANKSLTYSTGADPAGWDLTQVLRIPGTKNYKYKEAPRGKLLWTNDNAIGLDDIPSQTETSHADAERLLDTHRKKLRASTIKLLTARHATVGKRSEVIWRLENELNEQDVPLGDIFTLIKFSVWNKFAGRHDEDAQLKREVSKLKPRDAEPCKTLSDRKPDEGPRPSNKGSGPIKRMSDVAAEHVTWIWYPYIPRGKVTLIEGDPGLGKSWVTMSLAAHISNRERFPGAQKFVGGRVLIMSAEDGLGDTVRPRLDTMKADVSKIYAYDDPVIFDEVGCAEVEEQIAELRPAIVIIDPLVAYMGGQIDLHKANETREIMARLARLAEKYQVGIVALRHLTKGGRDKSIYRGQGSIDLTAAARSVMLIGRDPNEPNARAIVHIKGNLAPLGPSIKYELRPGFKCPFRWGGFTELTAEDILKADRNGSDVSEFSMAKSYLQAALTEGARSSEILKREAEARGINPKILGRVARELGIKFGEKWRLPE